MDNRLLLFILLAIGSNKKNTGTQSKGFNEYLSNIKVDEEYTLEKINVIKKIGPYLPEEYIPLVNKSILITEGFIKINELMNLLKGNDYKYISEPISLNNHKERLNKIIKTIQKETPRFDNNNIGMIMDLILNMDKYKSMLSLLTTLNQDSMQDPSSLIKTLGPILGLDEKSDKGKEIGQMMEIFKVLNSPKNQAAKNHDKKDIKAIEGPS